MNNEKIVRAANQVFYDAFNKRNIEAMKQVWQDDEKSVCIHPGWPPLKGLKPILNSWSGIFENSGNMEIRISGVEIQSSLDLAWVTCTEKLFTIAEAGVLASEVFATNLYCFDENTWKMVMHHASPIPVSRDAES
jgi:ketosteroid isomerase-like protein